MPNQYINPASFPTPTGYSYVVRSDGARTIYTAGQVAVNDAGDIVGEGDLAAQAEQVFNNLRTCLEAAGATFENVVKMTTYVVNFKPEDRPIITAARQKHLPAVNPPASTLVGVQALAVPSLLIEIEAIAVID